MASQVQPHPVRVAVVGGGYWGKNLVRNTAALGALECICDADPDTLAALTEKYPVRGTTGFAQVLADPLVTAVMLATPAERHFQMAREALAAGKHVFVEKPLALHANEAEALCAQAAAADRILMVGHLLEYHPAVLRLKELIDAGELGQIRYVYSNRLNLGRFRTEENILWSFAPHDISVILRLLGEDPVRVTAHGGNYLHAERRRRHGEYVRVCQRRERAHFRELAASLQGAAAGGGGRQADGGLRRHGRAQARAVPQRIEWVTTAVPRRPRRSRCRFRSPSRWRTSASTSSSASPARGPSPTAKRAPA